MALSLIVSLVLSLAQDKAEPKQDPKMEPPKAATPVPAQEKSPVDVWFEDGIRFKSRDGASRAGSAGDSSPTTAPCSIVPRRSSAPPR